MESPKKCIMPLYPVSYTVYKQQWAENKALRDTSGVKGYTGGYVLNSQCNNCVFQSDSKLSLALLLNKSLLDISWL